MNVAERKEIPVVKNLAVHIPVDGKILEGNLTVPEQARALVIFAHGSGSSRHSPRNNFVAETLNGQNLATLLADLLTAEEEVVDIRTRHLRFDIPMLAERLEHMIAWAQDMPETEGLPIGLFGSSTGAGAALIAAARMPELVSAVVSRGGRPDLAGEFLPQVKAPGLLIVGGNDPQVITLNKEALAKLNSRSKLEIVPGATHLFEEPGTLETAANLAADWFTRHD